MSNQKPDIIYSDWAGHEPERESTAEDQGERAPIQFSSGAVTSSSTNPAPPSFIAPSDIPQDLAVIMEMVANDEVVGSIPPIDMTAAEKRKMIEEDRKLNPTKDEDLGQKAREVAGDGEKSSDSDSSSEFESSSEEESDEKLDTNPEKPMTEEEHKALKSELDALTGQKKDNGDTQIDVASDSESEIENVDDYFAGAGNFGFEFMEDDEDDAGPSGGAVILSTHEAPLPPVLQPPLSRLPQGQGLSLAGDVVSWMREKKVETWVNEQKEKIVQEDLNKQGRAHMATSVTTTDQGNLAKDGEAEGDMSIESIQDRDTSVQTEDAQKPKPVQSNFSSAGTVVIRALQSRPGDYDEGWLEEGSVLCWEDGRVLGIIHETFGPLTSPFYSVRLPPPPHPYPELDSLASGTRLFYPLNPLYRSFVNMSALHDPRLKGSDASNIYDEEIGEDEQEWSDDEIEAAAKRNRKNKRGKRRQSKTPSFVETPRTDCSPLHLDQSVDGARSNAGSVYDGHSLGGNRDLNSRGRRGQGRDRGRGRGRNGPQGNDHQFFPLPLNPMQNQQTYFQPPQPYYNAWQQSVIPDLGSFSQMMAYPHAPGQDSQNVYQPNQPSIGMPLPMFPQQAPVPSGVAINPRFASQYQMMMNMEQLSGQQNGESSQMNGYGQHNQQGYE
ncbi:hypothetical protein L204_101360 [Cryptococcus depauperatus]|nr:hypothetical protein L204_04029 [Cryptococcus depauperatus CBS 7855]